MSKVPEVIETQKFQVVDEHGTIRATFSLVDGAPALTMRDGTQECRLAFGLDADGTPSITMCNENGTILWQAP